MLKKCSLPAETSSIHSYFDKERGFRGPPVCACSARAPEGPHVSYSGGGATAFTNRPVASPPVCGRRSLGLDHVPVLVLGDAPQLEERTGVVVGEHLHLELEADRDQPHAGLPLPGHPRARGDAGDDGGTVLEGDFTRERNLGGGDFVFAGRNVEHMSRSGARSRIDAVVRHATEAHPQLSGKRISAHVFRHSCAMSMLDSGVDLSTIAIWLGHEGVQTTHRYMVADMARKEVALSKVHQGESCENAHVRYVPKGDVLDFMMSL